MNIYYSSLYYKKNHITGANKRYDEIGKRLLEKYQSDFKCIVTESNIPSWCPIANCLTVPDYNSNIQRVLSWLRLSILMNDLPSGVFINDFMPIPIRFFRKRHTHFQLIHDLRNFEEFKRGGLGVLTSSFQKRQLLKADKLITVSEYSADMLYKTCGIKNKDIVVSYNGVHGGTSKSNTVRNVDVLYIATFEPRKNHMNLLKALEIFKTPLNVVFVGSDLGLKDQVREYANNISINCGHKISFYEQISSEELDIIYSSSKIFCSPSLYEGFGMPIIEAYQHRCQVVCSDIDVFKEVTLNNAIYFNPKSANDIFNKLSYALSIDDDFNTSETADEIVEFFSWDKIVERLCVSISGECYE